MQKNNRRATRKLSIRKKISGTDLRPRISVYKSNRYFYAQAIDDIHNITITGIMSEISPKAENIKILGEEFALSLKGKNISEIVYDRSGYAYHGKVSAFADGLRNKGIKF